MPRAVVIRASGIAFAAAFMASFFILGEVFGSFGDSDEWFAELYAGDRPTDLLGAVTMALSAMAFCVFAVYLAESRPGRGSTLLTIALASFAVLMLASAACVATIPATRAFGGAFSDEGQATSAYWLLPQLAYLLLGGAGISAACALLLLSVGGAAPTLPVAVRRTGAAAAVVLSVGSVVVIPLLVLPLWVCVASIWHGVSSES